jgi:uncharacterized protein (DUF1778 family)
MTSTSPRVKRINLRATTDELTVLRQAAAVHGITLTAFILTAAVRQAEALLANSTTNPKGLS